MLEATQLGCFFNLHDTFSSGYNIDFQGRRGNETIIEDSDYSDLKKALTNVSAFL